MIDFVVSSHISAEIIHCAPVAVGSDLYRVIVELRAKEPPSEVGKLLKEYEVWAPLVMVEDSLRLSLGATPEDVIEFAKRTVIDRVQDSDNHVPDEDGILFKSKYEVIRGNPNTFPLKVDDRQKLVKTTILLSEDTHKWLKEYGAARGVSMGDAIRRVVADFQVGTSTIKSENQVADPYTGGVANRR